jgi:hypothetical protein
MKIKQLVGAFALAFSAVSAASAAMVLDDNPSFFYQQTAASPCVIGGNNCLNGTFPQTVAETGGAGKTSEYYSPIYDINAIISLVPDIESVTIGIDYNQNVDPQILYNFTVFACAGPADDSADSLCSGSSILDAFVDVTGRVLQVANNGVGFSDFLFTDLDLSSADYVQFYAKWFNNDGADRYFIVGCEEGDENCGSDVPPVPEPSSMLLMGGGLLGLAWWRKRKNS